MIGRNQDEILIAGATAYDDDNHALYAVMAEWASNRSYSTRVANLQAGTGSTAGRRLIGSKGANQTVFNDDDVDKLIGSQLASPLLNDGEELYDYAVLRAIADIWADGLADPVLASLLANDLIDSEKDQLTGGAGGDWFLGNQSAPRADILTDFSLSQGDQRTSVPSQLWLLDTMSELGEVESLRLQMYMERRAKSLEALSNLLLKISTIQDQITGNMK